MTWVRIDVYPAESNGRGDRRHGALWASSSDWEGYEAWAGWVGLLDRLGELPTVMRVGVAP